MDWKWKQIYKYIKIYKKKKVYGLLNTWLGGWWDYYTGPKIGALSRVSQGHVGYALVMANCNLHFSSESMNKSVHKMWLIRNFSLRGPNPSLLSSHGSEAFILYFYLLFFNQWVTGRQKSRICHYHPYSVSLSSSLNNKFSPLTKRSIMRLTFVYIQFFGNWI